uniref:Olfactory receptor n=1 Tax=Leptobrachium leishanense TaxID=445787 RepID=A0A8C5M9F9_9ANUR
MYQMWKTTLVNKSNVNEFSVQGFTDSAQLRYPLFIMFLSVYITIVMSNLTVIAAIVFGPPLHTPMYVFLCNLSVLDIFYTSTVLPKFLIMTFTQYKVISFAGCMAQLYFFLSFASIEVFLLAVMAYDRYVAICRPLRYSLRMSPHHCARLVFTAWICGLLNTTGHTVLISNLSFCASHHIDYFFCDVFPLLKLSCSDTSIIEILTFVLGSFTSMSAFFSTLISYLFIISTILNIHSATGRQKTFSTCASHLVCVVIFYGTIICLYVRPASTYSPDKDKFFALLYIILIPLLNPLIYTLKNKDFKKDFKDVFKKINNKLFCTAMFNKR